MIKYSDIEITGSLTITGSLVVDGVSQMTSSNAINADTASFVTASNVVGTVESSSYALTASSALNAVSSSYALTASFYGGPVEIANTLSPQYTEVTFDSGIGNAITIDGFLQIYANIGDQFFWRLASGVSDQRTFRESRYWRIVDNISSPTPVIRGIFSNSTTWQPIWSDTTLDMTEPGDSEMMKLVSIPSAQATLGMLQPDTRVYHIICVVGVGYNNNKVYWRGLPKENLLF